MFVFFFNVVVVEQQQQQCMHCEKSIYFKVEHIIAKVSMVHIYKD